MNNNSSYRQIVLQNLFTTGERLVKELIIDRRQIKSIQFDSNELTNEKKDIRIHFDNAIIFPGLMNSHDHLDFDLFPKLGNKVYEDYIEWGIDIHKHNKVAIDNVLKVPRHLRVQWGIYKNLLAGVTTVVHHGAYVKTSADVINVFQQCKMLHSMQLEKFLLFRLNNPFSKKQPYVIHIGEGINKKAHEEIDKLIKYNFLKKKLIGVHGISMDEQQAKFFEALIWCPDSNLFLQGKTAPVDILKKNTIILFGTDSTVSADWNIWNQLRIARKTALLTNEELYNAVTGKPALVWNINAGNLSIRKEADIVVAKRKTKDSFLENFYALNPEDMLLVIKNGEIILFDESLYDLSDKNINTNGFSKVFINNICKYVFGGLAELMKEIRKYSADVKFPIEIV